MAGQHVPIGTLECFSALPAAQNLANLERTFALKLPRFDHLPEYGVPQAQPLAIVSGGPSLKGELASLRAFPGEIMVCGSTHDYVVQHRVPVHYAVINDPRPRNVKWLQTPRDSIVYLVASHCDPVIFRCLAGCQVATWHCHGEVPEAALRGEPAIGHGGTTSLRAISLAILLGYSVLHFYGLDCSYDEAGKRHAYRGPPPDDAVSTVTIESADGVSRRQFQTKMALVAQAQGFFRILRDHHDKFRAVIHGDGMLTEMVRAGEIELQQYVALA